MINKEYREDFDLMLQQVEHEIEWYDLQLQDEYKLSKDQKKQLLKKKYAILCSLKNNFG